MKNNNPSQAVIVLVDDEPMVTQALAAFLELETEFQVETFQDPKEALKFLEANRAHVVVSDFMMPEMNGLEFLSLVRDMDEDLPRVMLTGYADKENAIRAINQVGLFQYLEKPLDNDLLMMTLENAIRHRSLQTTLAEKIHELDFTLRQRDELHLREEEMGREMDWARTVQRKFLPEQLPSPEGWDLEVVYSPAMAVGGDFYDFISLARGKGALILADSAGHGVQAALGTALLKFATSTLEGQDLQPGEIMAALNSVMYQGLPREIPVAAAVAVVDPATGIVQLVGGGLPMALLLETNGELKELPAKGLLLGLLDQEMYNPGKAVELKLEAGQRLLLFSDGLTEAQNSADVFFGEGPMQDLLGNLASLPIPDLAQKLAEAAINFGLPQYRDDLTLVVFGHSMPRKTEMQQ